jgi:hypothetical protein
MAKVWVTPTNVFFANDVAQGLGRETIRQLIRLNHINASVVEPNGDSLPIETYNDTVRAPPTTSADEAATTSLYHMAPDGVRSMAKDHVEVALTCVTPRPSPPETVVLVHPTRDGLFAIRRFNAVNDVVRPDPDPEGLIHWVTVQRNAPASDLTTSLVLDQAIAQANSIYADTGVVFRIEYDAAAITPSSSTIGVNVASFSSSLDDVMLPDSPAVPPNVDGVTRPCDFGHDEGLPVLDARQGKHRVYSVWLLVEQFEMYRLTDRATWDPATPPPALDEPALGQWIGAVLAHEVGYALGLLEPQLFGDRGGHRPPLSSMSAQSLYLDLANDLMVPSVAQTLPITRRLSEQELPYVESVVSGSLGGTP